MNFSLPGKSIFSPPKPPQPQPIQSLPPAPPLPTPAQDTGEAARREEERLARKRRSGLGATRLTQPGLGDAGIVSQATRPTGTLGS